MQKISLAIPFLTIMLFLIFLGNVVMGMLGRPVYFSDVGEMLTLFAACICFVITVLLREHQEQQSSLSNTSESNK